MYYLPHQFPLYFNPRSPRGLRLYCYLWLNGNYDFNPRSPRGLRLITLRYTLIKNRFQSTQPKRAATMFRRALTYPYKLFQSTQPKRAATPNACNAAGTVDEHFNPRSPRGLRQGSGQMKQSNYIFQSTQPKRAATRRYYIIKSTKSISIHAAQEGCDLKLAGVADG